MALKVCADTLFLSKLVGIAHVQDGLDSFGPWQFHKSTLIHNLLMKPDGWARDKSMLGEELPQVCQKCAKLGVSALLVGSQLRDAKSAIVNWAGQHPATSQFPHEMHPRRNMTDEILPLNP